MKNTKYIPFEEMEREPNNPFCLTEEAYNKWKRVYTPRLRKYVKIEDYPTSVLPNANSTHQRRVYEERKAKDFKRIGKLRLRRLAKGKIKYVTEDELYHTVGSYIPIAEKISRKIVHIFLNFLLLAMTRYDIISIRNFGIIVKRHRKSKMYVNTKYGEATVKKYRPSFYILPAPYFMKRMALQDKLKYSNHTNIF